MDKHRSARALTFALAAATFAAACSQPAHERLPVEKRTVEDTERRIKYVADPNWLPLDGNVRCVLDGSYLTFHVFSLIGAKKDFVAALPKSLDPQLEAWAHHDYLVVEPRQESSSKVGPLPALEYRYVTRARPEDRPSLLTFWIVRNKTYLYVFRASLRPDARPESSTEIRRMLDGMEFLEPPLDPGDSATVTFGS
jgi:hypothetical protein